MLLWRFSKCLKMQLRDSADAVYSFFCCDDEGSWTYEGIPLQPHLNVFMLSSFSKKEKFQTYEQSTIRWEVQIS